MGRVLALFLACTVALTAHSSPARADADLSITRTLPKPEAGGVPWSAADIEQLQTDLNKLLAAPTLRGALVGLIVQDTVRGTVLYSLNADQDFQPASNFKLIVGSASLDKLGTAFRFHTEVRAAGTIANGTLTGDLFLIGGGDAHLTADDLNAAAQAVAAAGITHVTGSVIGDATRYDDQRYPYGWDWDDVPYYYAAPVSALTLEENVYHAHMQPGNAAGTPVQLTKTAPETSAFNVVNHLTTGAAKSDDTSDIVRPWDQPRTVVLTGSYPLGAKVSGDLMPAVPDAPEYAVDVFARALAAHGVTVAGAQQPHGGIAPAGATLVWSHDSEPMTQLMADFWWPSDNLMGELFLKEFSLANGAQRGNDSDGAKAERSWLRSIGVDPTTVTIADGSGLSNYDRVTPRDLLLILQHDWNSANREVVLDSLPVAGVIGTLKGSYKGTPAEYNVWAKTGSINHVRTISGFLRTRRHGAVTFSFMVNNWMDEDNPGGSGRLATLRGNVLSRIITQ